MLNPENVKWEMHVKEKREKTYEGSWKIFQVPPDSVFSRALILLWIPTIFASSSVLKKK